ncbi:MAG TPA: type II secretion system protein [Candidatus Saccharimonadales bacterium]|nr:type II secretion system protein [Candidatus Saccharimonadales bacterium]
MSKNSPFSKGFTLVELLIVIAVLGILASIILVIIDPNAQFAKARNAARKQDLRQLQEALDRYKIANGGYPISPGWCGSWPGTVYSTCGTDWIPGLVASGEVKKLPQDPLAGKGTVPACAGQSAAWSGYLYYSNGVDFKLLAHCTPEGDAFPHNGTCTGFADPFCDPLRPTWAWAVYTPGAVNW